MSEVTIRELRNHGGEVIERVAAGETLTVTRAGKPVAELRPLRRPALKAAVVVARWSNVPRVDPAKLRADLDAVVDPSV